MADGHVAEHRSDIARLAYATERGARFFVQVERFRVAILPVEDVAHVACQAGKTQFIAVPLEDGTGARSPLAGFLVEAEIAEGLQSTQQCAGGIEFAAGAIE